MNLTTIIITKNEENNIVDVIDSVKFSKQIIVVDNGSWDRTVELARQNGADVFEIETDNFSKQREKGLPNAKCDWILFIDADERVTNDLRDEIEKIILSKNPLDAYKIKRRNFYLGENEWPKIDLMERLFRKESIKGWHGKIHESPIYTGNLGVLENFLDHYTHKDLTTMLEKTIKWSDVEARTRFEAGHPRMTWWRFPRVMITSFLSYFIIQRGYRLATVGLIESIYQAFSTFITYAKLWEMQKKN